MSMHMSIGSQTTGRLSLAPNRLISFFSKPLRHLKARTSPCTSTLYNLHFSLIYLHLSPLLKKYIPLFKGRASPLLVFYSQPHLSFFTSFRLSLSYPFIIKNTILTPKPILFTF